MHLDFCQYLTCPIGACLIEMRQAVNEDAYTPGPPEANARISHCQEAQHPPSAVVLGPILMEVAAIHKDCLSIPNSILWTLFWQEGHK